MRIVTSKQTGSIKVVEGKLDDGRRRLVSEAMAPMFRTNVKTDLVNFPRQIVRSEPAAAHVLARIKEKYGPVLDAILCLAGYFNLQTILDLRPGQLPPGVDKARDPNISP